MSKNLAVAGNTEHTRPENRAFFPALDGLRAVAFCLVFLNHYLRLPYGWVGVDIFFVLSGFLITGILFDTRDDPHRARNFYLRRTLRIFPLYYAIMLALALLSPFAQQRLSWEWILWPLYLGNYLPFLHPFADNSDFQRIAEFQTTFTFHHHIGLFFRLGQLWTLCVEEQFYLLWPWLVFLIRDRRKLLWLCGFAVLACPWLRLLAQHQLPLWMLQPGVPVRVAALRMDSVLLRATPFRMDSLLLGAFLALWLRGPHAASLRYLARFAFPALVAMLLAVALISPPHSFYPYPQILGTFGLSFIDITAAFLLLETIRPRSFLYRILSIRPFRWAGRISYGAYVFHDMPAALYGKFGTALSPRYHTVATAIIAFVCTFALAALSYRFFESPFLNLKEKWTTTRVQHKATQPA